MELKITDIYHLLKLVSAYDVKRKEIEKIYEESGHNYNIFDILQLASSEVRLHSSIIASLLSRDGHGAKDTFLKEFLRIPKIAKTLQHRSLELDCSKTRVEVEKYIGPLTDTTGGRIDLFLSDDNNSIIIENKIYAVDQKNQLFRYHNSYPNGVLVYLTLIGDPPSKESLGQLNVDSIICLSYKDDIIPWLSMCVQLAANLPYVRETINQYINTLKQLTNSNMITDNDVIEILAHSENIGAAFAVRNNFDSAINKIMNDFLDSLKKDLPDGFTCITNYKDDWLTKYNGFRFECKEWRDLDFAIEFEGTCLSSLAVGIVKKKHCKDIRGVDGAKELAERLNLTRSNDNWFLCYARAPYANWFNVESIQMLLDGRMKEWLIGILTSAGEKSKGLFPSRNSAEYSITA